jgi:3-hydroxybutyryl-CoA dehydrogenase
MIHSVVVCGAGTMGYGIAFTCAQYGYKVILYDISSNALEHAQSAISNQLQLLINKEKISAATGTEIQERITYSTQSPDCRGDIIIEAVAEVKDIKVKLLSELSKFNTAKTIYASNTSSLSVNEIARETGLGERLIGLHFFNPAPLMKLVEVVRATHTSPAVVEETIAFSKMIGKTPVICNDSPGFIVNRVARHFYLEALKQVESGSCTIEAADILLESCGFKMGPFKLMDLIGNDVNLAVTESLYHAFGEALRFRPSALQKEKVDQGALGRKTKKGYYTY